jgi:cardiolipin synthase A/B
VVNQAFLHGVLLLYVQEQCQSFSLEVLLKLLIQPGAGATALLNAIAGAKSTVEIAIFRFAHRGIEEALVGAVRRGVAVTALIAHVNGSDAESLRKLEMRLLAAGVTVARTDTALARYHSKYLIIDRKELFVLAFNFTHQDIHQSRSFGLIIRNRKLVAEAIKLFEADTLRQPYKPAVGDFIVSPLNARKQLSAFLKGAKSELLIYDPRISDSAAVRLLAERAKAGISIRIIGHVTSNEGNLPVRELGGMRLHTRSILRDRNALFIGSQSLRELELDGRREVGVICRDRAAVSAVLAAFEEDWVSAQPAKSRTKQQRPAAKVAKKISKAISRELPPVASVLDSLLKSGGGTDVQLDADEIDGMVRDAVKDAVKVVLQQVIEEKVEEPVASKA